MSIDSCQFIHVMYFISFQLTSFQLTMNSYKPCPFFETSAPARAGHYLGYDLEQLVSNQRALELKSIENHYGETQKNFKNN